MKRNHRHEDDAFQEQDEQDIGVIIVQMQQQLANLERKIDSLISQSPERPFKSDSRPFERFDRFSRRGRRDRGDSYRERSFTQAICAECGKECEVPFKPTGDRPVYCKDCFSRRKQGGGSFKAEFDKGPGREEDFTQRPYSDKKQSRKNRGHGGRRSLSHRRKERA